MGPYGSLETPHGPSANILTPPHTGHSKRPHLPHITPVRVSDADSRALLMSPAFSLPQPPLALEKRPPFSGSLLPPTQPIPMAMIDSVFMNKESYEDESASNSVFEGGVKKKKAKKARREGREVSFLLDSTDKPPYSYATLIGMAILSHPDKQLTLSQIYLWISETFKYYRQGDVGWQNLIRHNLSLNKAFVKGEKSKDGKGHHWLVQEDCQDTFLKAKNNKRSSYEEVMEQLAAANSSRNGHLPLSPNSFSDDDAFRLDKYRINNHTIVNRAHKGARSEKGGLDAVEGGSSSRRANARNTRDVSDDESDDSGQPTPNDNQMESNDSSGSTRLEFQTPTQAQNASRDALPVRPILAGKNSPFTLSFSCSLNFEFLPLPPMETGPLLEPLTPGRPSLRPYSNNDMNIMSMGSFKGSYPADSLDTSPSIIDLKSRKGSLMSNTLAANSSVAATPNHGLSVVGPGGSSTTSKHPAKLPGVSSLSEISFNSPIAAYKSHSVKPADSVASASLLSTSSSLNNAAHLQNTQGGSAAHATAAPALIMSRTPKQAIRTPLRILKTPMSGSLVRKLGQSPSYLEDFYHSPFVSERAFLRLYDDDDMILRAFDSPAAQRSSRPNLLVQLEKLRAAEADERGKNVQ